jgi:hypothetical protein
LGISLVLVVCAWNGKVFKLERFTGTNNEYAEYLDRTLYTRLDSMTRYGCHGKSIPKFLLAFDRQSRAFVEQRTTSTLADLQYISDSWVRSCGRSPRMSGRRVDEAAVDRGRGAHMSRNTVPLIN